MRKNKNIFNIISIIVCMLLFGKVKGEDSCFAYNRYCDTLSKKEFNILTRKIYKKLSHVNSFSDDEMKHVIKVYNTLFLYSSANKNKKFYLKKFHKKFDKYYVLPLKANDVIITTNSAIFYKRIEVSILNVPIVRTGNFPCSDIFEIK